MSDGPVLDADEFAAFMTACLDERAAAALAAGSGRWRVPDSGHRPGPALFVEDDQGEMVAEALGGVNPGASLAHIALNDPALALGEVEAGRKILARHDWHYPREGSPYLVSAQPYCDYDHREWPCPDVLDLAAVYRDRPGYRPAWEL